MPGMSPARAMLTVCAPRTRSYSAIAFAAVPLKLMYGLRLVMAMITHSFEYDCLLAFAEHDPRDAAQASVPQPKARAEQDRDVDRKQFEGDEWTCHADLGGNGTTEIADPEDRPEDRRSWHQVKDEAHRLDDANCEHGALGEAELRRRSHCERHHEEFDRGIEGQKQERRGR